MGGPGRTVNTSDPANHSSTTALTPIPELPLADRSYCGWSFAAKTSHNNAMHPFWDYAKDSQTTLHVLQVCIQID